MARLTAHYAHWPVGVPHTLEVPDRNIFAHLARCAETVPDKPAIVYYGRETSYRELHDAALALAGYMQQRLDVRPGDRVLLLMQNCPQFVIAYYAVLRCAAVVVAINPMSTAGEVSYFSDDSGARVLVTTQDLLDKAHALLDDGRIESCLVGAVSEFSGRPEDVPFMEIPDFVREPRRASEGEGVHEFSGAIAAGIAPSPMQGGDAAVAVVAYTSGTTGKPKGAMLTHRNFAYAVAQRALWMNERAEMSELVALPISHLAGMNFVNHAIFLGRTIVLLARWDASAALELIERLRVAAWGAVTPMLAEVFSRPDIARRDLSSITRLFGGATAMPEALIRQVEQRLGLSFIELYGLTEACGATHANPPQAARRQCAGIPHINCDARVIDPQSGAELGPKQPGEIVSDSPTVFAGYWNNPEATSAAFIDIGGRRFLRSGDIGYYDEEGFFYVTDRLKRMINASGLKVWPAEIESALYGHPAVEDVCVISALDSRRGETVKALVVLRPAARGSLSAENLTDWARGRMAVYKVPRVVEFVDTLPRTATGKILWRELQAQQNERDRAASLAHCG